MLVVAFWDTSFSRLLARLILPTVLHAVMRVGSKVERGELALRSELTAHVYT